ncbi:MAG TPA: Vms1/Ankzf1 family peptidyl-tRNA hydrolase [Pyrinomonadaceae bacterium]|nr:Vms1/Ankzf1 family peptidyl-tRNA hydrolase [Pyrinomonadaceae bacterium]
MIQKGLLKKLAEVEASGLPFISVYLNAQPDEHGKDNFDAFLRKQLSEQADNFEEDSVELESFERDAERIREFIKDIRPSANGVAIFACAGADDFFQTIQFDVPFENNRFFVFDRPHLFPLARLMAQNPKYAVVLADTNSARILAFQRGRVLEKEEIENTKTNRTEVGGWSQMRYQRHIDNYHMHHAKEVIEELDKIVRDEDIKQIILAGNEEVVIPILRENLTKELEGKIVGTVRADIDEPEKELFEKVEQMIHEDNTLKDKEKIDNLFEQNYDEGLGVTGVEKTLEALANGQVQELYLSANFNDIEFSEKKVKKVLKAYAPGEDGEMPNVKEPREIADELVRRAIESADDIRFIEDGNLLEKVGGVGALLRYRMTANQNT